MANRAARHGTGTSTTRHGTARHGTPGHDGTAVPCRIAPPCPPLGPGTALWRLSRAVPCRWARRSVVPVLARGRSSDSVVMDVAVADATVEDEHPAAVANAP